MNMSSHTLITQPDMDDSITQQGEINSPSDIRFGCITGSTVNCRGYIIGSLFSKDQQQNPLTDFRTAMK